jgi:hypothetical protein
MLIEGIRAKDYGEKTINCITCDTKVTAELQNVFDTRFGIEKAWDICRCMVCGTKQTIPIPLSDELKRLYETYYNFGGEKETIYTRFRRLFFSSKLYRFWLAIDGDISFHSQKGTGLLLDVGCNEGRGLSIYQRNEFEGLELNEQTAAEARIRGYSVYTDISAERSL